MIERVQSKQQLHETVQELRKEGKKIVFTNGCFDLLHVGHARYMASAKALGDILIVGLNSDESVKRLKGATRPFVQQDDRAELLAFLEAIDYVTIFEEDTPEELIRFLKPDIHVKGGDYKPEELPEAKIVWHYGGKVEILPFVDGRSTTNLARRIRES